MLQCKRGDVWLIDLGNSSKGSTQKGVRPCVVIQNNIGNKFSPTTLVIPFTTVETKASLPTHVVIRKNVMNGLLGDSLLLCESIITIDKSQMIRKYGMVLCDNMKKVEKAVRISLVL